LHSTLNVQATLNFFQGLGMRTTAALQVVISRAFSSFLSSDYMGKKKKSSANHYFYTIPLYTIKRHQALKVL
jgi:hypothetical protein